MQLFFNINLKKTNLKEKIEEYYYLGKPRISMDVASWNDGKTLFEIYKKDKAAYSKMTNITK